MTEPLFESLPHLLADQGCLIEGGWLGFKISCDIDEWPEEQQEHARVTFYAGAKYLLTALKRISVDQPTPKDHARMDSIEKELRDFIVAWNARHLEPMGSA